MFSGGIKEISSMKWINYSVLILVAIFNNLTQRSIIYSCLFVYSLLIVRYLPCLLYELRQISDYKHGPSV